MARNNAAPAGKAEPAPGEDNNKRLAFLEAGVSALAVALTANGVTIGEGGDPIGAAVGMIKEASRLHAELEEAKAKISALEEAAPGDDATPGEIAAIARAEAAEKASLEAEKEAESLRADILDLEDKVAQLREDLEAAGAAAPAAPAAPRERSKTARDFGPTFGRVSADELAELIGNGEAFEIGFSNGSYEIVELAPVAVNAADLISRGEGFMVAPPIFVTAGEQDDEIHGAALLLGGVQVDYCAFPSPVKIEPRMERRFEQSIVFAGAPAPVAEPDAAAA